MRVTEDEDQCPAVALLTTFVVLVCTDYSLLSYVKSLSLSWRHKLPDVTDLPHILLLRFIALGPSLGVVSTSLGKHMHQESEVKQALATMKLHFGTMYTRGCKAAIGICFVPLAILAQIQIRTWALWTIAYLVLAMFTRAALNIAGLKAFHCCVVLLIMGWLTVQDTLIELLMPMSLVLSLRCLNALAVGAPILATSTNTLLSIFTLYKCACNMKNQPSKVEDVRNPSAEEIHLFAVYELGSLVLMSVACFAHDSWSWAEVRKQVEFRNLYSVERAIRSIMKSTMDATILLDAELRVAEPSPMFAHLIGCTSGQVSRSSQDGTKQGGAQVITAEVLGEPFRSYLSGEEEQCRFDNFVRDMVSAARLPHTEPLSAVLHTQLKHSSGQDLDVDLFHAVFNESTERMGHLFGIRVAVSKVCGEASWFARMAPPMADSAGSLDLQRLASERDRALGRCTLEAKDVPVKTRSKLISVKKISRRVRSKQSSSSASSLPSVPEDLPIGASASVMSLTSVKDSDASLPLSLVDCSAWINVADRDMMILDCSESFTELCGCTLTNVGFKTLLSESGAQAFTNWIYSALSDADDAAECGSSQAAGQIHPAHKACLFIPKGDSFVHVQVTCDVDLDREMDSPENDAELAVCLLIKTVRRPAK